MSVSFVQSGGLFTVLSTDRDFYAPGEPVRISLFKLNVSPHAITFTYPTTQRYDFSVAGPGGEIWRWSAGRVFALFTSRVTLRPGQSVSYSEVWRQVDNSGQQVPPGFYRVTGWNTFIGFAGFQAPSLFIAVGLS